MPAANVLNRPFTQNAAGGRNLFKFKTRGGESNMFSVNNLNNSIQSAEEDLQPSLKQAINLSPVVANQIQAKINA